MTDDIWIQSILMSYLLITMWLMIYLRAVCFGGKWAYITSTSLQSIVVRKFNCLPTSTHLNLLQLMLVEIFFAKFFQESFFLTKKISQICFLVIFFSKKKFFKNIFFAKNLLKKYISRKKNWKKIEKNIFNPSYQNKIHFTYLAFSIYYRNK